MNRMADRLSFSGAAVVVLIFLIALTGDAQTQPRQQPSPYDVKKNEMNVTTITLMAQGTGSTYLPIAEDLQNVLDDPKGNTLRVVPVVGRGGAQNLVDLLFLRGVDLAITQQEHLLYLKQQDPRVYGSIEQRVHYITKLYNSEFHLVAKKNIKSLRDLEGKRVSLNRALSATDVAGRTIFKLLNINPIIENIDVETSVKMVRSGELAAASSFAGAPVAGYAQIQDADLHFVPVDEITIGKRDYLRLLEQFLPSSLGGGDYPRLIGQGQSVPTLASGAMPGVFPPVPLDGRLLTDGGVAADIPILQAEALGATESYILPCVLPAEPDTTRGAVAVLLRALSQVFDRVTATDLSAAQGRIHLLPAPRQGAANPFDFRHTESLIAEGYAAAQTALTNAAPANASLTSPALADAA